MRTRYVPAVQEALAARPVPLDNHQCRAQARWERRAADFAVKQARQLAMSLYHGTPVEVRPYSLGLVLGQGEVMWAETQARCSWDKPPYARHDPGRLPLTCWVATSWRLSGRLSTGRVVDLPWSQMTHCRVDLSRGKEWLALDGWGTCGVWYGIGIAPLAVAAIFKAYGALALLEHPGLAALRVEPSRAKSPRGRSEVLALPAHDPSKDLLQGL
jgi:hypothetical protein